MNFTKFIQRQYHKLRGQYVFFRLVVQLKNTGIFTKVFDVLHKNIEDEVANKEDWGGNKKYYDSIEAKRIQSLLHALADDKSREIWKSVIKCRTQNIRLRKGEYVLNDEYFPPDIIKLKNGEVFVDCGAYIGDTVQSFINHSKRQKIKWKKIVAFEPTREHYESVYKFFKNCHIINGQTVLMFNKGVYKQKDRIYFEERHNGGSKIVDESDTFVDVVALDDLPECQDATYIKMDIEGAEMDALKGAEKIITKNHPKLAICIYHSNEDMIRIIEYVHGLVPEYKLHVRNHSGVAIDTVLYAVP